MKSFIVCLLLLMSIPYAAPTQNEENPPIFSVTKLKMDYHDDSANKKKLDYVRRETGRVAVFDLDESEEYLMRVDPPEHCTRFVICPASIPRHSDSPNDQSPACFDQTESVLVYRHVGGESVYKKTSTGQAPVETLSTNQELDDYIKVKRGQKTEGGNIVKVLSLTFKIITLAKDNTEQDETKFKEVEFDNFETQQLRVETSSFYCNVHIGTTNSVTNMAPTLYGHKMAEKYESVVIDPFKYGKAAKDPATSRESFGPLFRKREGKMENLVGIIDETELKVNDAIQCPFAHDWMGFARWPHPQNEDEHYVKNFWKGPAYHYHLEKNGDGECSKYTEHTPNKEAIHRPFTIDIDIDEVVSPTVIGPKRCFGFALVFGTAIGTTLGSLNPKNTFEFYPVSMMFLAPDSDAIRELRVTRENLHKIRISFYAEPGKDYAIVEYGFLNEKIGGVREYVQLEKGVVAAYKTVTLLQEGFCTARVHNTPAEKPEKRCWSISGCDVLQKK